MVTRRPNPVARSDKETIMDATPTHVHGVHRESGATPPGPSHAGRGASTQAAVTLTSSRPSLDRVALGATLHCLLGCGIGEVLGMVIGTALGLSTPATIALAVVLAFGFGYAFTMRPLVASGIPLATAAKVALAADTASITIMEIVDNGVMLAIPGAMDEGLSNPLFWGALGFALLVAFAFAYPLNRYMIARGQGHAVVHAHHGSNTHSATPQPAPSRQFILIGLAAIAVTLVVTVGAAILVGRGESHDPSPTHATAPHEDAAR